MTSFLNLSTPANNNTPNTIAIVDRASTTKLSIKSFNLYCF